MKFKHTPVEFQLDDVKQVNGPSGRYYVTPDGAKYPSITTVTGFAKREAIQEWRAREPDADKIMKRASERGTLIHDLMEKYVRGDDIDLSGLMPIHKLSFGKLKGILDERLTEYYCQETRMYSHHLGVAGTMDLAGRFDGVRSVIDFKTSLKPKKKEWIDNYFQQGAGYAVMFEERTGIALPNIVIVMDIDNSDPVVFKEHRDNWVSSLQEAIDNYNREMRCRAVP